MTDLATFDFEAFIGKYDLPCVKNYDLPDVGENTVEHVIGLIIKALTDPDEAYRFCYPRRMPELEPIILTSPKYTYFYAINILKERWKEGEPTILKDPTFAHFYARNLINGRWLEAEEIIKQDPIFYNHYCSNNNLPCSPI